MTFDRNHDGWRVSLTTLAIYAVFEAMIARDILPPGVLDRMVAPWVAIFGPLEPTPVRLPAADN